MRNDSPTPNRPRRARRLTLEEAQPIFAPMRKSDHALLRAAQRQLSDVDVAYILAWGQELRKTGVSFFHLGAKDIPPQHRHLRQIMRLAGAVVLVAADGEVITAYPHGRKLRLIRRKMKYRITPGWEVVGP
ncbi:MAG: hypothetical protein KGO05_02625, partial [Chloroflexota bacterium]|nr:hypothetical protein [Chloroflexota bacterium]